MYRNIFKVIDSTFESYPESILYREHKLGQTVYVFQVERRQISRYPFIHVR